ncbi:hypothetical protein [Streptomyces marincola]|nr:hypothetical protein [Streptomyces marincola]
MPHHDDFTGPTAPRRTLGIGRLLGGALVGLVLISGLIGALLLARPALDVAPGPVPGAPEAAEGH